jgi:hypothetical protein
MRSNWMSLILLALALAGCAAGPGGQTSSAFDAPLASQPLSQQSGPAAVGAPTLPPQTSDRMRVMLVPSEIVVGPNRFAVGLFDLTGGVIDDANVHLQYYDLGNPDAPQLESEGDATRLRSPDGRTTIFADETSFPRAGNWGVAVQARFADGTTALQRVGFQVLASSPTLKVGQQVPPIDTPTAGAVHDDLTQLTSAADPNPAFYQLSLAQALQNGRPTVLLLATPAFCQSRLCGPAYEVTSELQKRFGDKANFIHVEVYTGLPNPAAANWPLAPAMQALGLQTEPWLYLIGKDGRVIYRVEGLFTADEVGVQIQEVLRSN